MSAPQLRCLRPGLIPVAAFVTGFASIAAEISASRLIAPYFGSSTFIWASLIGTTLLFLSLGYWLGGRVADARPDARYLYGLIGIGAIAMALIIPISRPILRASLNAFDERQAGAFIGSLFATLLLFGPTMIALGMVAPFAIRLRLADVADAGKAAGSLYALSTAGSILGSFVPVLVLLPFLGTRWTFAILAITMAVMSIIGLLVESAGARASQMAVLVGLSLLALGFGSRGNLKPPFQGKMVAELESANNYIQVLQDGDNTLLALNDGHAIHSIYNPYQIETGGPWDYFSLAPILTGSINPQRALIVGLAGGTAARQMKTAYPEIHVDGVEIDPEIARVAKTYFGLTPDIADVHITDGRYFLETTDQTYDIVALDAYRQPYVPFHLATVEFFQLAADHLNPGGVVVANAGRTDTDFRLVDALATTMHAVFRTVIVVDVGPYDNSMVFGTNEDVTVDQFRARLLASRPIPFIGDVAGWALETGNMRVGSTTGTLFTDDKAPVEWIIDEIIFDEAVKEEK